MKFIKGTFVTNDDYRGKLMQYDNYFLYLEKDNYYYYLCFNDDVLNDNESYGHNIHTSNVSKKYYKFIPEEKVKEEFPIKHQNIINYRSCRHPEEYEIIGRDSDGCLYAKNNIGYIISFDKNATWEPYVERKTITVMISGDNKSVHKYYEDDYNEAVKKLKQV